MGQHRWLTLGLLVLAALICLLPMLRLAGVAVADWAEGDQSAAWQVLRQRATWLALWHSIATSAGGMLVAMLLGGLFATLVTLTDIRAKALWVFGLMLPMMIPPQVTALAWLQMTGPSSALLQALGMAPPLGSPQPLYSAGGIMLLLGVQHAALVYLAVRTSLLSVPADLIEAAQQAGASRWRAARDVLWPLAQRGLGVGAALAFVSALGNFGIPALLGIPVSYYVLPTLIYQKMAGLGSAMLPQVATLSMLTGLVALAGLALQHGLQKRRSHRLLGHIGQPLQWRLGGWRWCWEALLAIILLAVLAAPLLALLAASLVPALGVRLTPESLSWAAYAEMLGRQGVTWRAGGNSLLLSLAAALLLVLLSLPLAWLLTRRNGLLGRQARLGTWLQGLLELPYAIPGVVLAVACILAFARPLPWWNVGLYGTLWLILLAYLARFWIVALRPVLGAMQELDPAMEEAAQLAGAGMRQRLQHILAPLLAPAIWAAGLLVFLTALNELTVSALLWSAGNETLGVLIFNFNESGESVLASAISVLIVLFVVLAMLLLAHLGRHLPRGAIPWRN
ncbi:iron ABC transporter permease [Corticibacter populi]|uniref:Iron ABC transporter permease n=2 Tax=Corticibacter populi TaxID=1550736 RepID=A0A3M6R022_9BURK|nr:iron ABC transporter permease [Corticibacter populi]RZS35950.1 iron(III) transport system permease protein [Corticibacter populi]